MARLTTITTKGGDQGTSRLADGSKLPKTHCRFHCLGTQDELQAQLGLLLCALPRDSRHLAKLQEILQLLFDFGGELALPQHNRLREEHIAALEADIETLNSDLPPLQDFLLPGRPEAAARTHLARALCRRLERHCWELHADDPLNPVALVWLNRLSDWLFVLARTLTLDAGENEPVWNSQRLGTDKASAAADDMGSSTAAP